jgi:replicative DNA helicase
MDKMQRPSVAEMQRLLDLIATNASKLKARIEAVQCTAIDARLTLMGSEARSDGARQARQRIATELGSLADEIETLIAEMRTASLQAERRPLQ